MGGTLSDDISSCLLGDTVYVYVGPKEKRYIVHKALLTRYPWFESRMRSDHINLPEEDPTLFELLVSWLYRRDLKAISTTDDRAAGGEATLYILLYLRACEWEMQELQNVVMDRVRSRKTCPYGFFPRNLIKVVYISTKPSSPLRSYIVNSFLSKGIGWNEGGGLCDLTDTNHELTRKRALKSQLDAGNEEFVLDCYEALFQLCAKRKIRDPDRKTGCVYHVHEAGGKCGK